MERINHLLPAQILAFEGTHCLGLQTFLSSSLAFSLSGIDLFLSNLNSQNESVISYGEVSFCSVFHCT